MEILQHNLCMKTRLLYGKALYKQFIMSLSSNGYRKIQYKNRLNKIAKNNIEGSIKKKINKSNKHKG